MGRSQLGFPLFCNKFSCDYYEMPFLISLGRAPKLLLNLVNLGKISQGQMLYFLLNMEVDRANEGGWSGRGHRAECGRMGLGTGSNRGVRRGGQTRDRIGARGLDKGSDKGSNEGLNGGSDEGLDKGSNKENGVRRGGTRSDGADNGIGQGR